MFFVDFVKRGIPAKKKAKASIWGKIINKVG